MQFGKAVAWIGLTSVIFAAIGALIGFLLGKAAPGYYRSVFGGGSDPLFDPVAVGLGQGLTQGLVLGAGVGLILVLSNWWKEAKLASLSLQAELQKSFEQRYVPGGTSIASIEDREQSA
jgi:hypothetical protein